MTALTSRMTSALAAVPGISKAVSDQLVHIVRSSCGAAIASLGAKPIGTAIVSAVSGAAVDAARIVCSSAASFVLLGLIATLLLPRTPVVVEPKSLVGKG